MASKKEHFVTCGQMKLLEQRADADGLSYYQMMENAGTRATEVVMEMLAQRNKETLKVADNTAEYIAISNDSPNGDLINDSLCKENVFVFCGKGNNGGDGFVVARLMCNAGYNVSVILVDGEPKTTDSITNYELLKELPVKIYNMAEDDRVLMELKGMPIAVVDAVYGTGFHGYLKNNALKVAIYINKIADIGISPIFALDIPSGLGGDLINENLLDTNSVKADYTITFHAKKPVHLKKFAKPYCGEIVIADIGIDEKRLWEIEY